jgi:hypothetical protein
LPLRSAIVVSFGAAISVAIVVLLPVSQLFRPKQKLLVAIRMSP